MEKFENRIHVGQVAGVHGLRGELKIDLTAVGSTELEAAAQLWFTWPRRSAKGLKLEQVRKVTAGARRGMERVLVTLDGLRSRTMADPYHGAWVWMDRDDLPDSCSGEVFSSELLGLNVVHVSSKDVIGKVVRFEKGPQSRLVVGGPGGEEYEIPFVEPIIHCISLETNEVVIDPPEGLLELGK